MTIKVPDNATNGDMIIAMFKPYKVVTRSYHYRVYLTEDAWNIGDCWGSYLDDWWNAPWKREVEIGPPAYTEKPAATRPEA